MERDGAPGEPPSTRSWDSTQMREPKSWFFEAPACFCGGHLVDDDELLNPSERTLRSSSRLRARSSKLKELAEDADRLARELDSREQIEEREASLTMTKVDAEPVPSSCSMIGIFFAAFLAGSTWNYSLFISMPVLSAIVLPE